ncbi:hypothetical protein HFV04_021510 [Pseudomonas sp. BIGb0427]|uniref:hypothetical protein n=1 Tax=Pseudomonas sp. BIGb0427 TaxID=2724470 RepID=UPI0016B0EBED|nr:hypothetical protein [Pseudomonas sp. BIGb0427]NLU60435.1 hypothetical protein [Pseudomonas sp. BIGb0427]QPG62080.1 hypothetical protein HFV04_021510 [Pseudomonas sp. BIGb0427]
MTYKLKSSDADAWDEYAAAALNGYIGLNMSFKDSVPLAAQAADALIEERIKRRKAHGDYISGKES